MISGCTKWRRGGLIETDIYTGMKGQAPVPKPLPDFKSGDRNLEYDQVSPHTPRADFRGNRERVDDVGRVVPSVFQLLVILLVLLILVLRILVLRQLLWLLWFDITDVVDRCGYVGFCGCCGLI